MQTATISGYYGSGRTPCTVLTAHVYITGATWYAVKGSPNVNLTYEPVENGVWVEELDDVDCFTWPDGVSSEDELIEAIEA